jgi:16S rRNA (adenine1518-N6/adenine1519-N6)-dimethyltransferase
MGRRLGQHFLRAASVERLLRSVAPRADDVFLEIGPGAGALTLPLAARCRRVVAIEVDATLAKDLAARAPANVLVVEGDALTADLAELVPPGSRVAGNLPYYISSPLLRRILAMKDHVRDAHVMLQDEVARRVASPPGSKEYGLLSVLIGLWANIDIPLRFPPGAFDPPPKVSSALLRLRFLGAARAEAGSAEAFERLVGAAFAKRRKTLGNNLQPVYPDIEGLLRSVNLAGSRRAETLSVVEFARLARALEVSQEAATREEG